MQLASHRRRFLALYVDAWLFAAVFSACAWWLPRSALLRTSWYAAFAIFGLLELVLVRVVRQTPGRLVLGITSELVVRPSWLARERWWTVLLGVLGLMEGVKEATRWTQGLPPPPFMGLTLSWDAAAAALTTSGVLTIGASLGVLRCQPRAALLGSGLTSLTVLSWLLSWRQIPGWVDARTLAARAAQGVAVRAGELALMRKVLPAGAIFGGVVGTLWLLASYRRFRAQHA
ncbi:MAG: hypothetical protein JWN04_2031 [Myxococcaceae bacterium]|nr:hypothetical protein [Myxococcaceae bacterium]